MKPGRRLIFLRNHVPLLTSIVVPTMNPNEARVTRHKYVMDPDNTQSCHTVMYEVRTEMT